MTVDNSDAQASDATLETTTDAGAPEAPVSVSEAPVASAEPGKSILEGGGSDKPVAAPADWPEDWRAKLAGADAKEAARLQRMGSPADVWKAYRALEAKLSSGQVKPVLAPDATPEEVATWRKENGLPEAPDAYVPKLANGMVPGESDAPMLEGFKKTAFEANMTPDQFNKALNWYYSEIDGFQRQQEEKDLGFHAEAEDTLRKEWGAEYRQHINSVNNITALAPDGVAERFLGGRTADGKRIGDDPGIIKWLASISREFNPAAPYVPVGSSNPAAALGDRISQIEKIMHTPEYWKDEKVQTEYRDLVTARDKMQSRSSAA